MTDSQRILVAGATGYIGGRLIPALLDAGHEVRGLARTPGKLAGRVFASDPKFSAVGGDVLERETLNEPLAGVDAAYYPVDSLGAGSDFRERDIDAATNFSRRARPPASRGSSTCRASVARATSCRSTCESRQATGDALREGRRAGDRAARRRDHRLGLGVVRDHARPDAATARDGGAEVGVVTVRADRDRSTSCATPLGCLDEPRTAGRDLRHRRRHGARPTARCCVSRPRSSTAPFAWSACRSLLTPKLSVPRAASGDERRHAGRWAAHRRLAQRRGDARPAHPRAAARRHDPVPRSGAQGAQRGGREAPVALAGCALRPRRAAAAAVPDAPGHEAVPGPAGVRDGALG